jgi:REP element-mobilizing transposase RayT
VRRIYEYRRRLPHYQSDNRALFVTFRKPTKEPFSPAARDLVLKHCLHDHGTKLFMHAAVVMPEHVHLLLSPLRDKKGEIFSMIELIQPIKSASAHTLNRLAGQAGPVWQDESFDHVLRSDESLHGKADYIRMNPVRRGLVVQPEEYRWLWIDAELRLELDHWASAAA